MRGGRGRDGITEVPYIVPRGRSRVPAAAAAGTTMMDQPLTAGGSGVVPAEGAANCRSLSSF